MCVPVAIGLALASAAVTAGGQIVAGTAAHNQATYEANLNETNAKLASQQANDANQNTMLEAQRRYREGAQLQGRQTAAMAANGIDLGFGSAEQVQGDTRMITGEDVGQIYKAGNERAKGFDVNAFNYRSEAAADRAKASASTLSTVFGVASTALGAASQINKMSAKPR
jgi:hypothetical protein